jgi:purine nucleoside phosphorylase
VTNFGTGLSPEALTHEEVMERAGEASGKLTTLLAALLPQL